MPAQPLHHVGPTGGRNVGDKIGNPLGDHRSPKSTYPPGYSGSNYNGTAYPGENGPAGPGENPEMLRWRADVLLDEMMLGGVDLAAGDYRSGDRNSGNNGGSAAVPIQVAPNRPYAEARLPAPAVAYLPPSIQPSGRNDYARPAQYPAQNDTNRATQQPSPLGSVAGPTASTHYDRYSADRSAPEQPPVAQGQSDSAPAEGNLENQWLFSAERRYQQATQAQPAHSPPPTNAYPVGANLGYSNGNSVGNIAETTGYNGPSYNTPSYSPPNYNSPNYKATQSDMGRQAWDAAAGWATGYTTGEAGRVMPLEPDSPARDGVRRAPATFANTIGMGNNRRSNLLPRMSAVDDRALHQEIFTLQSELEASLPTQHDAGQRARHLLEKAQNILDNDPMRSAEVDYYLQQVRTIFQRMQQNMQWSNLYRRHLITYLAGWVLLAVIALLTCWLYQPPLENFVANVMRLEANSFAMHTFAMVWSALFAGALGGAGGALANIWLHSWRTEHYFDRKAGLRGLILPLIGALMGVVLALFIGGIAYAVGTNPANSSLLGMAPALLALLFGASQEALYGTRE